jgi:sigma-B regulation protein RsbU (phosphoserine phosphatase)
MAVSVASIQAVVGQGLRPSALLTHLDQAIAPYTRETGQNCALVYVEISLNEDSHGTMCAANAGCMIPLIRRVDGSAHWVEAYGTPLGMELSSELSYEEVETSLSQGDLIILTSDGVVEATAANDEMFGFDRLKHAAANGPQDSPEAMLTYIKEEVATFVGQTEQQDDLTIVVIQL